MDVDAWLAEFGGRMPAETTEDWRDVADRMQRPAVDVDEWLSSHADQPPAPLATAQDKRRTRALELANGAEATVDEWLSMYGERVHRRRLSPEQRLEIFERDGWVCGLCGGLAFPRDRASDPRVVAVLDHIVPLRPSDPALIPGTDSDENLQCAHALCNLRKHNHAGWRAPQSIFVDHLFLSDR